LWKQYLVYVDLFKFYVDLTWKATTWFYATTGVILVYYFDHGDENSLLRYSLCLPFILSLVLSLAYGRGLREMLDLENQLEYKARHLELPGKPHVDILGRFLIAACALFLLTAFGVFLVFMFSFIAAPIPISSES
jgi:hypothetical protein